MIEVTATILASGKEVTGTIALDGVLHVDYANEDHKFARGEYEVSTGLTYNTQQRRYQSAREEYKSAKLHRYNEIISNSAKRINFDPRLAGLTEAQRKVVFSELQTLSENIRGLLD